MSTTPRLVVQKLTTRVCIVGGGPAGHAAAIYVGRALLSPVMLEGWMANGVAPGGQACTRPQISRWEQSVRCGTRVFSETATSVDLASRPFKIYTQDKTVEADTLIIATGAIAKRLHFKGAEALWNRGISACAVCDGAAPIFRGRPLAVVGGGDTAMEEANFLSKYGSKVFLIHRRGQFRASKVMQERVFKNPKIEVVWDTVVEEARERADGKGLLGALAVRNLKTGKESQLEVSGLFFAIGHTPASAFLGGQLQTDADGYVATTPGTPETSVPGVFACGDVQDKQWRQAVTAAGSGCMAALAAAHYLEGLDAGEACPAAPSEVPTW